MNNGKETGNCIVHSSVWRKMSCSRSMCRFLKYRNVTIISDSRSISVRSSQQCDTCIWWRCMDTYFSFSSSPLFFLPLLVSTPILFKIARGPAILFLCQTWSLFFYYYLFCFGFFFNWFFSISSLIIRLIENCTLWFFVFSFYM
jgi:hypothetical protein